MSVSTLRTICIVLFIWIRIIHLLIRRLQRILRSRVLRRLARCRWLPAAPVALLQVETELFVVVHRACMLNLVLGQGTKMRLLIHLAHHFVVRGFSAVVVELRITVLEGIAALAIWIV